MKNAALPIPFAGSELAKTRNACAFFNGILQRNPFYVPPQEFLRELRERRAARQLSAD